MIKVYAFLWILVCGMFFCAEGVLTKGIACEFTYQGKKIELILLFDVHEKAYKEEDEKQLEDLIEILKERSEDLNLESPKKYYHILAEQGRVFDEYDQIITSLLKRVDDELPLFYGKAENIEQRGASILIEELIGMFPYHHLVDYRSSSTLTYFAYQVTLVDVLKEFETFLSYFEEVYKCSSSVTIRELHEEEVENLRHCYINRVERRIEELEKDGISKSKSFASQIDQFMPVTVEELPAMHRLSPEEFKTLNQRLPESVFGLKEIIGDTASACMDLYSLYKVLSLPKDHTGILVAGGAHCKYVYSEVMDQLDATETCNYGRGSRRKDEEIIPLTKEQLIELLS